MIKRPNLRIHGTVKDAEILSKGIESLFNEIIAENSQNLGKVMDVEVHEAFRVQYRHDL
jgi:hypothetical protein